MELLKQFANLLFKYRGYIPLPFILLMIIFFNGNILSMVIGMTFIVLGEGIRIWGVSYAGKITRTTLRLKADYLVTSGPFSFIRNPLYLGNIIIYLGFGIFSLALFPYLPVITVLWFIFQYNLIIMTEEEFLEKKFGEEYLNYKRRVPRFIPNFSSLNHKMANKTKPNLFKAFRSEIRTFQAIFSVIIILLIIYLTN